MSRSNATKTAQYLRNNPFLTEKHAAFADLSKQIGKQIAYVAAGTLTAAGINKGLSVLGSKMDQNKKSGNIAKMYAVAPQLRAVDPKMVSLVYDSLATVAPTVAADPLLASQYILQYAQRNQHDLTTLSFMGKMEPRNNNLGSDLRNRMVVDIGSVIANAPALERQMGRKKSP
jgi:hypothetical protein